MLSLEIVNAYDIDNLSDVLSMFMVMPVFYFHHNVVKFYNMLHTSLFSQVSKKNILQIFLKNLKNLQEIRLSLVVVVFYLSSPVTMCV